ncbi:hypothetical protein F5883DRAFT_562968, partial [Diaporthe sp. PMI_573]
MCVCLSICGFVFLLARSISQRECVCVGLPLAVGKLLGAPMRETARQLHKERARRGNQHSYSRAMNGDGSEARG